MINQAREKRLFSRIDCELDLTIQRSSDKLLRTVTCCDLSLSGVGLFDSVVDFEEGEKVNVALEGFPPVKAELRWSDNRRVGLRFMGSLSQVLDTWVGEVLAAQGMKVRDLMERIAL